MYKNTGFTLVELSIVLVIIGLLIGGILVAQSMTGTAKVQNFVKAIQQFDIAVNNFQTQHDSLPGDSTSFGCVASSNVCENGSIEDSTGSSGKFDSEIANFWPSLQASGFSTSSNFSPTISGHFTTSGNSPNSPKINIGNNTGIVVEVNSPGDNSYMVADFTSTDSSMNISFLPSIAVGNALAIDTKMDDGSPNSGNITYLHGIPCATSDYMHYNASNSAVKCDLRIRVLGSIGMN